MCGGGRDSAARRRGGWCRRQRGRGEGGGGRLHDHGAESGGAYRRPELSGATGAAPVHAGPSGAQARRAGVQQLRLQPQQQRRQRQEEEHGGLASSRAPRHSHRGRRKLGSFRWNPGRPLREGGPHRLPRAGGSVQDGSGSDRAALRGVVVGGEDRGPSVLGGGEGGRFGHHRRAGRIAPVRGRQGLGRVAPGRPVQATAGTR